MRIELPLKVLGLLGPILSWVEGLEGLSLPSTWVVDHLRFQQREQAWLIRELPSYSFDTVDEVVQLSRDDEGRRFRAFGSAGVLRRPHLSPPTEYDLADIFARLVDRLFVWNGGTVCVRQGRMEELHELGLRFPVGHLIRHDHAMAVGEGWISEERALDLPEQPNLLPSNSYALRTVVRKGLSEGHLHLMGVTSAEESWADSLLKPLTHDALEGHRNLERRLILLGRYAARVVALATLLTRLRGTGLRVPFYLLDHLDAVYFARNRLEDYFARKALREEYRRELGNSSLLERSPDPSAAWLLAWVYPPAERLRRMLGSGGGIVLPDTRGTRERTRFLSRLHFEAQRQLAGLGRELPERFFLHEALYRYLIFRTHHWQLATQYGKTTGLRYFKRFYDSRQRRPVGVDKTSAKRLNLQRLRHWRGLRVLEGRVSPPSGAGDLRPWIQEYAAGAREGRIRKFGLVIHFIKAEKDQFARRATGAGYPSLRYGHMRRQTREKAFSLFRLLSQPDPVVPFIVGIDAANLELTTPPEVYAPAFRFLRELPIEPRRPAHPGADCFSLYPHIRALTENRRLGMTYHVGEEFRHLLSGLRSIYEVMEFFHAHPGDRLGHAIALGLRPKVWMEQCGYQALMPKIEWLDTLVWAHHLLGPGHDLVGEMAIEDRIQRLAWEIYVPPGKRRGEGQLGPHLEGRDLSPLTLHDAWRLRQLDPYCLDIASLAEGKIEHRPVWSDNPARRRWAAVQKRVLKEVERFVGAPNAYRLLRLFWFDRDVRSRGNKTELVDMQEDKDRWTELCRAVQRKMFREVHTRQMVVEVNPSVNRVIGPMERLDQHHVFDLTLDGEKRLKREVRVTVNTDNPAVFNTSLAHEYYLLGEILIRRGVPEAEVVNWLEWLRQNGWEYSFVHQLPAADDPRMERLLQAVREAPSSVRSERGRQNKLRRFWKRYRATVGGQKGGTLAGGRAGVGREPQA